LLDESLISSDETVKAADPAVSADAACSSAYPRCVHGSMLCQSLQAASAVFLQSPLKVGNVVVLIPMCTWLNVVKGLECIHKHQ
jgi:hypothetical protein